MHRRTASRFLLASALLLGLAACQKSPESVRAPEKLQVVATLFPLYDFARTVGGDRVQVTLLLPPGVESHSYEPRPEDMARIARSDLFLFTNRFMEPWAGKLVQGAGNPHLVVVDASSGIRLMPAAAGDRDEHVHAGERAGGSGLDPHVWLDFTQAQQMVTTIAEALAARDPAGRDRYLANAAAYREQLAQLDAAYREGLAACRSRTLLLGGHAAFGYLARRYGLRTVAAYALGADAEPTPRRMLELVRQLRESGAQAIYAEELLSPRVAETIGRETGARVLPLHAAHNVGREDLQQGVTFLALMERNLQNLREGLACR